MLCTTVHSFLIDKKLVRQAQKSTINLVECTHYTINKPLPDPFTTKDPGL